MLGQKCLPLFIDQNLSFEGMHNWELTDVREEANSHNQMPEKTNWRPEQGVSHLGYTLLTQEEPF